MMASAVTRTACANEWRSKGVDLAAYNTEASADDLEDLRKAIGAPRISLFGFSYGTHLALSAIRRHGASIDRAILAGTEGPDDSQKYPHTFDLQLARLSALEAASKNAPSPNLIETTRAVMEKLERAPVQAGKLTIGKQGFQYLLRLDIGDTNDTANVIKLIRDTANGDYAMLSKFAERRYAGLGAIRSYRFARHALSGAWLRALGLWFFWAILGGAAVLVAFYLAWVMPAVSPVGILVMLILQFGVLWLRSAVRVAAWGSYLDFLDGRARHAIAATARIRYTVAAPAPSSL